MLDSYESLLPKVEGGRPLRALPAGFDAQALDEMESLLETLGVDRLGRVLVSLKRINPATYITQGKVEELRLQAEGLGADLVVVDGELSPNQMRNLEKAVGKPVLDRAGVILEIFSRHARTKEAKTQVELARLQYLLPRLAHFWTHFERQRGGIGNKGMGEKQLEVDRRLLKKRMEILRGRLRAIVKERQVQRASRKDFLKVALVGYTNAGKSTLLNALTRSNVLAENKLFATLDSSVRLMDPDSHPPIVAIDTVGFISRIPTDLIASFRSTLEELEQADLLLHVVDASSQHARDQIEVTRKVLKDLDLEEKPTLLVLNKVDLCAGPSSLNWARVQAPGALRVSALRKDDVEGLRNKIFDHFKETRLEVWEVMIPYSEGRLEALLHAHSNVERKKHLEKGTFYRVHIQPAWAEKLALKRYQP